MSKTLRKSLAAFTLAAAPTTLLAHHSGSSDVATQVAHAATDSFHSAISLALAVGFVVIVAVFARRRDRS